MTETVDEIKKLFQEGKNVKDFTETTPQGNSICGKILLNHGFYHGSLLIEQVNNEPVEQYVRGFPKIHYYEQDMEEKLDDTIIGFEKLDGTCVGFYPLYNGEGDCVEVVPKSRQRAVLDEHFLDMLRFCDTRLINEKIAIYDLNAVYVEMFGMLNEHTLPHKKTYIDLRLIGVVSENYVLLPQHQLRIFSEVFQVELPCKIVTISKRYLGRLKSFEGYDVQFDNNIFGIVSHNKWGIKSFQDVVDIVRLHLDYCNKIYSEEKGYLYYEGVVLWNDILVDDGISLQYIKVKPDSFLEASDGEGRLTIPVNEIRKEVRKIINENLSTYVEDYNEKEALSIIDENLLEEYSEADVYHSKTRKVIVKELHKYIDSIQDQSINKIVDDIIENNSLDNYGDLMRYFADKYPLLKHRSGDVNIILRKRLNKRGINI